jgi:uncharacterized surface protein with fasciclin (FAS1) repeats
MRRIVSLLLAGALAIGIAAPVAARSGPSIADIASSSADFETLTAAVGAAGFGGLLDGRRQLTVFAPTDAAFANLEAACPGITAALLADTAALRNVLAYHVAPGFRDSGDVLASDQIRMLNKQFADVEGATIAGANIVDVDIVARNGVIHVVDAVLVPAGLPASILSTCG